MRALAVHLTEGQLLPLGRSAQLISQLYGLTVSPATVRAWIDQASVLLLPNVERIAQALVDVPVAAAPVADNSNHRLALGGSRASACARTREFPQLACRWAL